MNAYEVGMFWSWGIFGAVFVAQLLSVLFEYGQAFIYDKEVGVPRFIKKRMYHDGAETAMQLLRNFGIGLFGAAVWPITWLAIIIYGCLFAARKGVRFQKVYEAHKHDEKTGNITR